MKREIQESHPFGNKTYFKLIVNHAVFYMMPRTIILSRGLHKNIKWYSQRTAWSLWFFSLSVLVYLCTFFGEQGGRQMRKICSSTCLKTDFFFFFFLISLFMHCEFFLLSQTQLLPLLKNNQINKKVKQNHILLTCDFSLN